MTAHFYTLLIFIYKHAIRFASIFNRKAKNRIHGLARQKKNLQFQLKDLSDERVLIHCASLGEYEQATPIIEWILNHTSSDIIVSFFSPSGYDNCKLINERCMKCYLPFDLPGDMDRFLKMIKPSKIIITKNEWWWNLLHRIKTDKIPAYLISSTIRKEHYFIKHSTQFFRDRLDAFDIAFVLNQSSADLLTNEYKGAIIIAGDTRKDKVKETKEHSPRNISYPKTIIYGSIWTDDLPVIKTVIAALPTYSHFIYPHELSQKNIDVLQNELNCTTHARLPDMEDGVSTFIINSMGQLKHDYANACIAYIGGGFGAGIHNILEAAVYGIPTFFGPKYQKSEEAKELIGLNAAFSISHTEEVDTLLEHLLTNESIQMLHIKLKAYFSVSNSPSEIICTKIFN